MKVMDTPDWLVAVARRPEVFDVLWMEPPPRGVRYRHTFYPWSFPVWPCGGVPQSPEATRHRIAKTLRTRPGRWAQIQFRGQFDSPELGLWLRRRRNYETTQRAENGNIAFYARYIGR